MSRNRIISLLIATLLVIALGVSANGSLGTRIGIESDPAAKNDVTCVGVRMTKLDCSLRVLVKQEPIHRRVLIPAPLSVLFGGLYLIAGLGGGVVASWLRLTGLRHSVTDWRVEWLLIVVAGLAGIVACVVLLIPGVTTLSTLISGTDNELEALRRLFGFGLLAGLYSAGFFGRLEQSFLRLFSGESEDE